MGIVNVTPDSFSDGGLYLDADAAVAHARALALEGADILDVGGESTRPGAEPVPTEEELRRVLGVLERIAAEDWGPARPTSPAAPAPPADHADPPHPPRPQISIDTSKALVARAALAAGAGLVNDVSAFRADPEMAAVVAESGAECCLMHMLGEPRTMQREPRYEDVVDEVKAFLAERLAFAVSQGVSEQRVLLDPGIGFGKTVEHNLELLGRLDELLTLGRPIVIGTSRKSFLDRVGRHGDGPGASRSPRERLAGTVASNVMAFERGASVFRVHEVAPVRDALALAAATLDGRWTQRRTARTPRS
jgi:dihydropteroate synthase